jgi:regulator of sirC expression with transglutaminase-like and TPR domain
LEWVYDGLAPLMLPDVLRRRKGIPIALALAAAALARRLGAGARLVCARDAEVLTTEAGEQA